MSNFPLNKVQSGILEKWMPCLLMKAETKHVKAMVFQRQSSKAAVSATGKTPPRRGGARFSRLRRLAACIDLFSLQSADGMH
jgi:hypothetical protein